MTDILLGVMVITIWAAGFSAWCGFNMIHAELLTIAGELNRRNEIELRKARVDTQ